MTQDEQEKPSRLAIMGGTFDPIHFGHLVAAEAARDRFKLDRVVFVPTGLPPHKKTYAVSATHHRFLMTKLAVASNPYFEVSPVEIERSGYSYTVDTVAGFKQTCGGNTRLFFITGADAILEMITWKSVGRLLDLCEFIAVTRPGYHLQLDATLERLIPQVRERVYLMEVPALAISSTDIRERVREGKPIKYLLPETVEEYILGKGLYARSAEKLND